MCPHTTLECVLLEIWLRSPHNSQWQSIDTDWWEWRSPSLHLPLPNLFTCQMELWHLQPGAPCHHSCFRSLVPLSTGNESPGDSSYCYSRGSPHFFFSVFPSRLYAPLSFLLQWLCRYSFPRLSRRSRLPDLDLRYDFLSWRTILFPHASPYSMVISTFPLLANNRNLPSSSFPIVLSLRKVPIGLVYKPALVSLLLS